jgi:hypothetical protein
MKSTITVLIYELAGPALIVPAPTGSRAVVSGMVTCGDD